MNDELEQFDAALSEQGAELSEAGKQRREAMRASVVFAARPRSHAGLRWGLLAAAAAALVLSLLWAALRTGSESTGAPDIARHSPSANHLPGPTAQRFEHILVSTVADDPSVLDRYRVDESKAARAVRVDDAELIALLALAGHQTGIIRMGEAVELTTPLVEPDADDAGAAE